MMKRTFDFRDLNSIYFSSFRHKAEHPHSLAVCLLLFLCRWGRSFSRTFLIPKTKRILLVAPTLNNQRAVRSVREYLSSYTYWDHIRLPEVAVIGQSLLHLPSFLRFYRSCDEDDRRLVRQFYDSFMSTPGLCIVSERFFRRNPQLNVVLFANDHIIQSRCLIETARAHGVRTVYVQHASVTPRFPKLRFDYSFLDGLESYEKYASAGEMSGRIFLSGSPRFDLVSQAKERCLHFQREHIGIALNEYDDYDKAYELCCFLSDKGFKLALRPHPHAEKDFGASRFEALGIYISRPSQEDSFYFLSHIVLMIANETSTHLDAAMMGVPSVLFNYSDKPTVDWYGYIRQGLVPVCRNEDELLAAVQHPPKISGNSLRYYHAAAGTPYEGKVGQLVAGFLEILSRKGDVDGYLGGYFCRTSAYYVYKNDNI